MREREIVSVFVDRFGVALRISAFGEKLNEATGLLQVRLLLATECGRLLAKTPIRPPDLDGPPFR